MIQGLSKLLAVLLSYAVFWFADLSFQHSNFSEYYIVMSISFGCMALITTIFAVIAKSNVLLLYSALHVISVIIHMVMTTRSGFYIMDSFYYSAPLNFGLIVQAFEVFIIITGGIDVYRSIANRYRDTSDSNDKFDARMGVN